MLPVQSNSNTTPSHFGPSLEDLLKYKKAIQEKINRCETQLSHAHSEKFKKKHNFQLIKLQNLLVDCEISILKLTQSVQKNTSRSENQNRETSVNNNTEAPLSAVITNETLPPTDSETPQNTGTSVNNNADVPSPTDTAPVNTHVNESPTSSSGGTSSLLSGWQRTALKIGLTVLTMIGGVLLMRNSSTSNQVVQAASHALQSNQVVQAASHALQAATSNEKNMMDLFYQNVPVICHYFYEKGHDLAWLVRHGKISQELMNFIISKGGVKSLWR